MLEPDVTRDSKNPNGSVLSFTARQWTTRSHRNS
nr:DUF397 domain-containing protein [Longimycelium tulufanense]